MNHHPWRPRPPTPIQGNICPICSNSHFPFCHPSSLSFTEPPRFQSNNQLPYAPPFDPYVDHRGPTMNFHRPFVTNQRPSWIRSPNYDHSGVGLKRMRIGEDDNDRRLKLIRDHGSMPSAPAYPYSMQPNHDYSRLSQFGNLGQPVGPTSRAFVNAQPPLPTSPPPPLPLEPQSLRFSLPKTPSLFPVQVPVTSSADIASLHSPVPHNYYNDNTFSHTSTGFSPEEFHARQASSKSYIGDNQTFPVRPLSPDTPKPVDASHIFKQPYRATRPDRIVVILRGLPGSGKSYLAKMIRDVEVENGGDAPRIHSMDDYFMTEVEKVEENDSSMGSARGKKRVMKVMEYCYEPEMEEAYRSSMLKAFKKTLDEGVFSFIIVDDRNLRIAHFAQFWATAKRSGYEVYLLEATYKDPAGCAARNVHSFSQDDIERMADQWEEAPSLYMKLDIKTLLHGDHSEESDIQEVDMDTEDAEPAGNSLEPNETTLENASVSHKEDFKDFDEPLSNGDKKVGHTSGEEDVIELRKSKWSDDLDDDDDYDDSSNGKIGNSNALSGLMQAYSKKSGKSVRWGDEGKNAGFSISAAKREKAFSLVIGPGAGYNLKSNPLVEEEKKSGGNNDGEWRKQSVFQEHLRAEKESFKAVFDKRRHRISGMENLEDG